MTALLLDTHAFVWWVEGSDRISEELRVRVAESNEVFVSDVSFWELAIKASVGKMSFAPDVGAWFDRHMDATRFRRLSIERHHIASVAELPMHHRDPFDRLLLAQAGDLRATLVTADRAMQPYDVEVVW